MSGRPKLIVVLLSAFSLLCGTGLFAQNRRVVVLKPGDAELRKAAARLRMCPDQLQNIRQLLEEAADLLPESTSGPSGLGHLLFRYHRAKAEDMVIAVVEVLAAKARQESDYQQYQRLSTSALELIGSFERYNPTLAVSLEDNWPQGPSPGITPDSPQRGPVNYMDQQRFFRTAQRNPEEGLRQLHTVPPSAQYSARSTLLNGLFDKGMEAEARRLVEQTLAAPPGAFSPAETGQFSQFARTTLELFPEYADRIQARVAATYQGLAQAAGPATMTHSMPNGQTIQVNRADQFLLTQIMMLNADQQFAAGLAELSPAISEKMRSAGGYSAFFRYNARQHRQAQQKLQDTPDDQLESSLRDKSSMELVRSASQACYEFPEKAEKIYEIILRKIEAEPDVRKAVGEFQNSADNCQRCVGELPDKWVSAGKELLRKVREKEQEEPAYPVSEQTPRYPGASRTLSSQLENLLLAFKAQSDFAGAIQDAHAIENKSKRFDALMRIAQHLTNR